ncbi:MAG: DinB family protein [Chitinophagaceae bacterium]
MQFNLTNSIQILEKTPAVLKELLSGLSPEWVMNNEGPETWSPYDVLGHLVHGEKTDWIVRLNIILGNGMDKRFVPFDRFAQFEESKGKSINQLLVEFAEARSDNLIILKSKNIFIKDLQKTGIHPKFGEVDLSQLLASYTIHDLTHIAQITRVMAKQYKEAVGPWVEFFRVIQ